ncbi:hypothetical protein [Streptomyces californicus]|uniref:hypothetical protein n=1 Tax=Streptomyces californicus TaxID=67351 RepID=UPI00296E6427|nr:hypothetical protein [Streptomyces californicus]MDW4912475.1 hypothetical protein [Streptomyces californicus]
MDRDYSHLDRPGQPRTTAVLGPLKELFPNADLLKVRAAPAQGHRDWSRAEVLDGYRWPKIQGAPYVPAPGHFPVDDMHTALTVGEFLAGHRHCGAVTLLRANDTAYTFLICLWRPRWELL